MSSRVGRKFLCCRL